MRRLALVIVAVVVLSAFAPTASAQVPPLPIPLPGTSPPANNTTEAQLTLTLVQLYLTSAPVVLGNASVQALSTTIPGAADDRNATVGGESTNTTWSGAGIAALSNVQVTGSASGTAWFRVTPSDPVPVLGSVNATIRFDLVRVGADAAEQALGSGEASVQVVALLGPLLGPVVREVNWTAANLNGTLLPGDALVLRVGATAVSPQVNAAFDLLYDSSAHPSGFNVTTSPAPTRGQVQLSATTSSRDAAPGASPTFVVSVRNLGDQQDTVRINATGAPADFTVRVNPAQLTLAAGSSGSALVTVVVPSTAADGTRHTTTVTAQSGNGASLQTLALTVNVRAVSTTPNDRDGDGYTDADETRYSSNPNDRNSTPDNTDSDGDGVSNRAEVDAGTDPFDPNDFPGSAGNAGGSGNFGRSGGSLLGPLSDPIAESLGVDSGTADILAILLILLFLLIIALLIWFLFLGYPVVVSLVEPRATTEPGRGADYAVEVRSKLGRSQQVDLEAAGLPGDWDVRFNKPHLTLEAKASEVVGMLVRPPGGWPAPSKRDFEVRARSRLKPEKFAKVIAKLSINARSAAAAEPPQEEAVSEAWQPEPERSPSPVPYVVPVPAGGDAPAFQVTIHDVRHTPAVPERGAEVTTTSRVDNGGPGKERLRVVLVVNGKVRDEVQVELAPGEGAEAEFHWVAYLARNEVKVVAERA